MSRQIGPWRVLDSREIYCNKWLRVREDQVVGPDGQKGTYSVIEFPPAVGIVALSGDEQICLVGQHPYAVDTYSWEIPAGGAEPGEELLDAAKRELREEAGLAARSWDSLGWTHPINGVSDAIYHIYLARDLEQREREPDHTEDLSIKHIPLKDALRKCQNGEISDVYTVVAVFRAWNYLRRIE